VEFGPFGGRGITAVNILTMDEYLYGVVGAEMAAHFHIEALKAQAVAARSYALTRMGIHRGNNYDLCDQGHCQAFRGMTSEHEPAIRAVNETAGQVIYYDNEPINAVYFSSSGGSTDSSENVWNEALPYLRGVTDPMEHEPRVWNRFFTWSELTALLQAGDPSVGAANRIAITRTSPAGRVQELTVYGTGGEKVLTKEEIRMFFAASPGGMLESRSFSIGEGNINPAAAMTATSGHQIRSGPVNTFYVLNPDGTAALLQSAAVHNGVSTFTYNPSQPMQASGGDGVTFSGSGWGHGVGMSQRGAEGMAQRGYSYIQILHHYYTNVMIR
jgi:stage II sporulation protein D